jgi:23S rRNA (pseudouridine1915-N3)-methyltransferase
MPLKITVAVVGRLKEEYLRAAEDEYRKRMKPYCALEVVEYKTIEALLAAAPKQASVYAFDERGDMLSSTSFADMIALEEMKGGGAPVWFVIGGADGMGDVARKRAKRLIAFGRLTIAHRLVRVLVMEQLYRAFKIARGEPYHRE